MLFDGILLCSDYDNTITDYTYRHKEGDLRFAQISKKNIDAIDYFVKNGGVFAVATGRDPHEDLYDLPLNMSDYVICSNGTAIFSLKNKKSVVDFYLSPDSYQAVKYITDKYPKIEFMRISDDNFNFNIWEKNSGKSLKEVFDGAVKPYHKIVIWNNDSSLINDVMSDLREKYGKVYELDRSAPQLAEIHALGSGKGPAVKKLAQILGGIKKTVCMGDNENDISMIKAADIGYAVANSVDALKDAADRITVGSDKSAVAAVIEDLEKEL